MRCGRMHTHQSCMYLSPECLASRNTLLLFIQQLVEKNKTGWYLGGWAICSGVVENGDEKP